MHMDSDVIHQCILTLFVDMPAQINSPVYCACIESVRTHLMNAN